MSKIGGYAGKILLVDLNTGETAADSLPRESMAKYLGGGGMNAKLAYDLIPKGIEPLSPDNVLILGSGPFVGTLIPGSGKSNITCKSPLTDFLGSSGGGHLAMLKFAGYDNLVIRGRAGRPAYLRIYDDEVEVCDAAHLWGRDAFETADILWDEVGPDFVVMAIGPAGERLVLDSSIIVDKCTAYARTGVGAVMGSKNLKAVVIKGSRDIAVAEPDRFGERIDRVYDEFKSLSFIEDWRTQGTLISLTRMTEAGIIPSKNFQETAPMDTVSTFSLDVFLADLKEGDVACMGCPVGCKHYVRLKDGPYSGDTATIGCVNSLIQSFGNYCAIRSWSDIVHLGRHCNRMGLDWYSFAGMYAFVAELQEKGLIGTDATDGLAFPWGCTRTAERMMEKMVSREGLGDAFARGLRGVVSYLGEEFAPHAAEVKGLGVMLDPRSILSCDAFSQLINPRGGHESIVSFTMLGGEPEKLRTRTRKYGERFGFPEDVTDRVTQGSRGYNVARLTKWMEDASYMMDFLGVCSFAMFQLFDMNTWADLYTALTGFETGPSELLRGAERGLNLRKAFNTREGASRSDDRTPPKFLTQALKSRDEVLEPLTEEQVNRLIDEYYDERGWKSDGTIEPDKLRELDLQL